MRQLGLCKLSGRRVFGVLGLGFGLGCGNATGPAPASVASIVVKPASVVLVIYTSLKFEAELRDSVGTVLVGRPVDWSSDDTLSVKIFPDGLAGAVGLGSATITATSGSVSGSAKAYVQYVCSCSPTVARTAGTATACGCSP